MRGQHLSKLFGWKKVVEEAYRSKGSNPKATRPKGRIKCDCKVNNGCLDASSILFTGDTAKNVAKFQC